MNKTMPFTPQKRRIIVKHSSSSSINPSTLQKFRYTTGSYSPSKLTTPFVTDEIKVEPIVYNVEFLDAWKSDSTISCSAIWFLDERRLRVSPLLVKANYPLDQCMLDAVSNNKLIKNDSSEYLKFEYEEQSRDKLVISFYFSPFTEPKYCRVWNAPTNSDSSVRNFKITLGFTDIVFGQVPQNYGVEVSLSHYRQMSMRSKVAMSQVFLDTNRRPVVDKYGGVPLKKIDYITFQFIQNYGADKIFGLNGLEFYDENQQLIDPNEIKDILFEGTINFTNPFFLLHRSSITKEFNELFMLEVLKEDIKPKMKVVFKEPKIVSSLKLYNATMPGFTNVGVKVCRIFVDGQNSYIRKFVRSDVTICTLADNDAINRQIKI